ncbi:MAG: beta-ketoacyl-[acyl-carrier-protein] synthase family protein [Phycisphaerales bacterium]|nr:beta-ketoacyl-[acyl-carrier-protein] synthase family protein [Phycisphaerales bacterium]
MRKRIVITGMGWITPLGCEIEQVWKRLLAGDSGMAPTTHFDASKFPTTFSSQVKDDFDLAKIVGDDAAKRHATASLNSRFALGAATNAWRCAGFDTAPPSDMTRVGIYLGGGEGPLDFFACAAAAVCGWEAEERKLNTVTWAKVARERLNDMREIEQEPNQAASHIACHLGVRGPSMNTLTACAASTQAIGEAMCIIRRGDADVMISGGTHSMIHPLGVTGFNRLTALSTRNDDYATASRPFDRTRDGFVLGEGAAMVVLESLEHAQARGATILAEVAGYGSTADAFRITDIHEDGRGAIAAMKQAIEDAGLTPSDIDYINAHGTSTEENDKIETLAIRKLFTEGGKTAPPISSVKSMLGHLIAAAGATELITCVLALRDGIIPPTMHYQNPDPNCELDYVPNEPRKADLKTALSNSFGFGGQNDTLVVRKFVA